MVSIDIETEAGQKETLRRMLLIREFDGKAKELFADGEIPGFVHLYLGEEAVGVGACGALEEDDYNHKYTPWSRTLYRKRSGPEADDGRIIG